MKKISILVPKGHSSLSNIDGTHHIFSEVNSILSAAGELPLFQVSLVGLSKATSQRNGLFTISPDILLDEAERTDLIIIPAIHGNLPEAIKENYEFIPWIK